MRSSGSTSVDDDLAAGRRREADEARDLDVVRARSGSRRRRARGVPWMWRTFEPIPSISAPMRDEEAAEILDVRLAGRVPEHRLALGEHGRHDRVLRAHDGGLVEVHARAAQPVGRELVDAVDLDVGAERGERVDVRVEPPAADHVATRRRHGDPAEAREQRPGEEERRANLARELGVEVGLRRRRAGRRGPRSARSTRRRRRDRRAARPSSRRRGCAGRSRAAPPPRRARTRRGSGARRSCCPRRAPSRSAGGRPR